MNGQWRKKAAAYRRDPYSFFLFAAVWFAALLAMLAFAFVIGYILLKGVVHLSPSLFAWKYTSENVSLVPALINTLWITALSLFVATPIGIGAAVYLSEYARRGNRLVSVVRVTAETLSGIPSIVYGLFGALFFVKFIGLGLSLLSGALTLAVMVLPLVLRTAEEALRAVPDSYREGSFGLGAGRLRTVFCVVLPSAGSGYPLGHFVGHGTHRRGISGAHLHGRDGCKGGGKPAGLRPDAVGAYVCHLWGRALP